MPSYVPDALAIVNLIKRNLQDRYASGYPILKELVQNADDARAGRFSLDALPGWPDAGNPLLRGPGLLVANDGEFSLRDRKGILAFGDSVKATDRATVGRFGLGQKAVFHLCDAFVVHAFDEEWEEEPFRSVVNPFLDVKVTDNATKAWEDLQDDDVDRLRGRRKVGRRALFLWLPFRRPDLRPARDIVGFSRDELRIDDTVRELARTDELQVLLSALRNLESIEILENGRTLCAVHARRADRLLGPDAWQEGERSFGGRIGVQANGADARVAPFVGREATLSSSRLAALQKSDHWPQTITIQKTEREKGEPHGAAILLRGSGPGARRPSLPSQLTISWAVFLPIAEGDDDVGRHQSGVEVLPIAAEGIGRVHLLLHGYFFLDGGRNRIEGLTEERIDDPKDAATLRVAWNAALRDDVVLPLIPAVLKDALDKKVLNDADLAHVVQAIGESSWFNTNRAAICKEHVLVRAVQGSSIAWKLASAHAAIRPLPAAHADARERLDELFPDVATWAEECKLVLCVNQRAALVPATTFWTAEELGSLFSRLQPCAFQSAARADLLGGILAATRMEEVHREAVGPHLERALRQALIEPASLASADDIAQVLRHAPPNVFFPLSTQVEEREVLRALASAETAVLPVRGAWLPDAEPRPASPSDLVAFLRSLEPLIGSEKDAQADQAAAAAVALLRGHSISSLANREDLASLKVLKARDPGAGSTVLLSLGELVDRASRGLLFQDSPAAERLLRKLIAAVPEEKPVIVRGRTADILRRQPDDTDNSPLQLRTAEANAIEDIVKAARGFGPDEAREVLIEALEPTVDHDRDALRMLCTGVASVRRSPNALSCLDGEMAAVERLVTEIARKDHGLLFVPSCISDDLGPKLRRHLAIQALDPPRLERLLDSDVEALRRMEPTKSERWALLGIDGIGNDVLLRLPIHARSDGSVGSADDLYWKDDDWPIPDALVPHVPTVRLSEDPRAQERQKRIIRRWDCRRQVETVLALHKPERFCEVVLDALAALSEPGELPSETLRQLKTSRWMGSKQAPIAPEEILALPDAVAGAALDLLWRDGERPPFGTIDGLPDGVRKHPALRYLRANLFPDSKWSIDALAQMLGDAEVVGLLGLPTDYPVEDFTALALAGAELELPAWPLLRSVLSSVHDDKSITRIVSSLRRLSDEDPGAADLAARHLDALAERARKKDSTASAARQAYRHGFEAVAGWPRDRQYEVFSATQVPTASGGWRSGREVAGFGHGIAKTHQLASEYADILERQEAGNRPTFPAGETDASNLADGPVADVADLDADTLEDHTSERLRKFLEPWRTRVPPKLVISFLSCLGRYPAMRQLAEEWAKDSTPSVEPLWGAFDRYMRPSLKAGSPVDNPLEARVDELRFQVTEVADNHVLATGLSGDEFEAPLGDQLELVVGNLHRESYRRRVVIRAKDGSRKLVIQLHLRPVAAPDGFEAARDMFRRLVKTVATDCLRLHMADQEAALDGFLDKVAKVDQTTLEETRRLLRDRLPTLLAEMKLPTDSRCQQALRAYEQAEGLVAARMKEGGHPRTLDDEKDKLWEAIEQRDGASELLSAVRDRIRGLGYSGDRVLFELFQNADDACVQQPEATGDEGFQVEYVASPAGFRVIHWGRPINHLGANHDRARQLGHDRDLLNMLVMNFSEKRSESDLTGKFGLGFKSVHVLSDSVGIASRFIALRTLGGILPEKWKDGIDLAADSSADDRRATLVDVPYSEDPAAQAEGRAAVDKFDDAALWLPAFARRIRRIDISGGDPRSIRCEITDFPPELPGSGKLDVVTVSDTASATQRMLRLDLGRGFRLLISMGEDGPRDFSDRVARLWNLAPLEEKLRCGWLINGPFRVDPGRGRLAGSEDDRRKCFERLGEALGGRLLELHDLASRHWPVLVDALSLAPSTEPAQFWSRLFDLMSRDTADDLACYLHRDASGYAGLLAARATAPTGLPKSFAGVVRAAAVEHYTTGALAEPSVLQAVEAWPSVIQHEGRIVSHDVAEGLRRLGFGDLRRLDLCDLLRDELGEDNRVDVDLAERLGRVIMLNTLNDDPIRKERDALLSAARQAAFRAQDGTWRNARELSLEGAENDDERRISRFAPASALLDRAYTGAAVKFFHVARAAQSGYGPRPDLLVKWAEAAHDDGKRRAVLRYVIDGHQGRSLAEKMRTAALAWLPKGDHLLDHDLLRDLPDEDQKRVVIEFKPEQLVAQPLASQQPSPSPQSPPRPKIVLEAIHDWWEREGASERKRYQQATYPSFFSCSDLQTDRMNRTAWFTMFALACWQSLGRTQDGQHRSFIDRGWSEGWWTELAESEPPDCVDPWLNRLEGWSRAESHDQDAHAWKRTFVDLYTVARWLSEYVEVFRKFPDIVRERSNVAWRDLLRPSFSSALASLGTEGAPLNRTLGIGVNWMIRELTRNGVYSSADANLTGPHCWAPTQRVRELLQLLDAPITVTKALPDESRAIYRFITDHIGADRARFHGDFDLPLQIITRERHRDTRRACLGATGFDLPTLVSE